MLFVGLFLFFGLYCQEYKLIFADEFDVNGKPASHWSYESGYVRNNESQYYTDSLENAHVENGYLYITARKDHLGHSYTSSSLNTAKSFQFTYGKVEFRLKFPTAGGSWPALWTLGNQWGWPRCGEVDIFEYYSGVVLANAAWSSSSGSAKWDGARVSLTDLIKNDSNFVNEFHTWVEEWDYNYIRIYLDGRLMNEVDLSQTFNEESGNKENPFREHSGFGHYLLVNLALGGNSGGKIDDSAFPMQYVIDYIRVYQK
jgi:beta-glucanase (GH16 family)